MGPFGKGIPIERKLDWEKGTKWIPSLCAGFRLSVSSAIVFVFFGGVASIASVYTYSRLRSLLLD